MIKRGKVLGGKVGPAVCGCVGCLDASLLFVLFNHKVQMRLFYFYFLCGLIFSASVLRGPRASLLDGGFIHICGGGL